jgi:hypothetical protein
LSRVSNGSLTLSSPATPKRRNRKNSASPKSATKSTKSPQARKGKPSVNNEDPRPLLEILEHIPAHLLGTIDKARQMRLDQLTESYYQTVLPQGPDSALRCESCLHPGHGDALSPYCPAARINSYIDGFTPAVPYEVGSIGGGLDNRDLFFIDLSMVKHSYNWAVDTLKDGDGVCFGVAGHTLSFLDDLLMKAQRHIDSGAVIKQKGFEEEKGFMPIVLVGKKILKDDH